jgi:hypothetical protein
MAAHFQLETTMQLTQEQMFYAASRQIAETNLQFLELVEEGMTREELARNIERRPHLWSRFESWLDKLPSKEAVKPAKLQFICTYRGCASYEVQSGPMKDKRIRVRYLKPEFYVRDWNGGYGWNLSQEEYERDIIAASGIADYIGQPVTADVLAALNKERTDEGVTESCYPNEYRTAKYVVGTGWVDQAAPLSI